MRLDVERPQDPGQFPGRQLVFGPGGLLKRLELLDQDGGFAFVRFGTFGEQSVFTRPDLPDILEQAE